MGLVRDGLDLPERCEYVLTYAAVRAWDLAEYMQYAHLRLEHSGTEVGYAEFRLINRGGLDLRKFRDVKAKMDPLIDELLQPTTPAVASQSLPPGNMSPFPAARTVTTAAGSDNRWASGRWRSDGGTNSLVIESNLSWRWTSTYGGRFEGQGNGEMLSNGRVVLSGFFNGIDGVGGNVRQRPITIRLTREGDTLAAELETSRVYSIIFIRE